MQQLNIGVRGEFDIDLQKVDQYGNVISSRRAVTNGKNLITNKGMDDLGNGSVSSIHAGATTVAWLACCHVGSGSTPPANGNTTLNTFVAGREKDSNGVSTWGGNDAVFTTVYTFPAGVATGNIAEVGISSTVGTGNLRTHALLEDGSGTPITITVLSDEQLVITYRLVFVAGADNVSNHNTSPTPTDYTITCRASNLTSGQPSSTLPLGGVAAANNWHVYYGVSSGIGAITSAPSGSSINLSAASVTAPAYVSGNFYRDLTVNIPINVANFSDIGAFRWGAAQPMQVQIGVSPRLTKAAGETLKITLRYSWSRI